MISKKYFLSTYLFLSFIPFLFSSQLAHAEPSGKIALNDLSSIYGEPKVNINLGGTMLSFASVVAKSTNPEASALVSALEFVSVQVYDLNNSPHEAFSSMKKVTSAIQDKQWEQIVQVNEENEKVRVFAKLDEEKISGIVVFVVNQDESVFINVVGELDPENLGQIAASLNLEKFMPANI